jgi:hypothetical protein
MSKDPARIPAIVARILGPEESRDVIAEPDPAHPGRIKGLSPGKVHYWLVLALPDGTQGKAEVPLAFYRAYHALVGKGTSNERLP